MVEDCLFCKIIKGEIPSTKVFENENVLAFQDIYPQAKGHLLFIHKKHSHDVVEMTQKEPADVAEVFRAISEYALENKLKEDGFRVVTNIGKHGGQTVFHTHFHVLYGEQLKGFGA